MKKGQCGGTHCLWNFCALATSPTDDWRISVHLHYLLNQLEGGVSEEQKDEIVVVTLLIQSAVFQMVLFTLLVVLNKFGLFCVWRVVGKQV